MGDGGARRKTHAVLADDLRARILNGELAEGERLPVEGELMVEFGVARTTLREALRVLESQGFITIRRGRGGGPIVNHPPLTSISIPLATTLQLQGAVIADLSDGLGLVERQIVGRLASCPDPEAIDLLKRAVSLASSAAEADDATAFAAATRAVHQTLAQCSESATLSTLAVVLQEVMAAQRPQSARHPDQAQMRRVVRSYHTAIQMIEEGGERAAIAQWDAAAVSGPTSAAQSREPVRVLLSD
jgi:GntR family transcriptional repressor for pyruvate dehydrogenase complex